jgi:hypothetical protein
LDSGKELPERGCGLSTLIRNVKMGLPDGPDQSNETNSLDLPAELDWPNEPDSLSFTGSS